MVERAEPSTHQHVFISYATEDEDCARVIHENLDRLGISSWFAPVSIALGESILSSIDDGLQKSSSGILLISRSYMNKQWTSYEKTTLVRQYIEHSKRVIPIWHQVDKADIDRWNPSLSDIKAANTNAGLQTICKNIAHVIAGGCPTRGVAPQWESPFHRFLTGRGELHANHSDGGAFTIWEALELPDKFYPMWLDGKKYSRKDFACLAAQSLANIPEVAIRWVGKERVDNIRKICTELGFDPESFY